MPQVALGSWWVTSDEAYQATKLALQAGYRHFDSAWNYGTQSGIGQALVESGLPREELFLTTKLADMINCTDAFSDALRQIDEALRELQTDYLDAFLIHHPASNECNLATWHALEQAHRAGKVRAIGTSNFCVAQLQYLIDRADVAPAVNQIAFHIGIMPAMLPVVTFCQQNGIAVMGYSPLAIKFDESDALLRADGFTGGLGTKYGRSGAEVSLRFVVQHGAVVITQTKSRAHLQSNIGILGWRLTDDEMAALDAQTTPSGFMADNAFGSGSCIDYGVFLPADVKDTFNV